MKYKIWCKQRDCYFADEELFHSLKECREQLISYHSVDCEEDSLRNQSLYEITSGFEWEIQDMVGNPVDYKILETIL